MTRQHIVFYWCRANTLCIYKECIDVIHEHSLTSFCSGAGKLFDCVVGLYCHEPRQWYQTFLTANV